MITITTILVAVLAFVFFLFSYRFTFKKPEKSPPGLPRLPIVGGYLFLMMAGGKYLNKGSQWLSSFYKSDIISLYIGNFITYVIQSHEGIREIFNNSVFDGRPDVYVARMRDPHHNKRGIFFQDGPFWKEQRRFILRYLRDFGFGRRFDQLELVIDQEIKDLIDLIKNGPKYEHEEDIAKKGQVLCPVVFSACTANCIFHVMFNETIPRAEQKVLYDLANNGYAFQKNSDAFGKMLSIIPWIRHYFPKMSAYQQILEANTFLYNYFDSWVKKLISTYTEGSERNFVDLYIKQMRKDQMEGNINTSYLYDQLVVSLIDFSFPAFTALGVQLTFIFQYLINNPEILKRIQNEIDEHVGSGRLPSLDDRKNLHYTEATIREGMRIDTLVSNGVPHSAVEDTEFFGYKMKKDTIIMLNMDFFHNDKKIWGDPEVFRPDRFLDENGKLSLKLDVSLPFGAGKRLCAGETFARNMLFLLLSALCQNFNFAPAPGDPLPDTKYRINGLIITPPDTWFTLESR